MFCLFTLCLSHFRSFSYYYQTFTFFVYFFSLLFFFFQLVLNRIIFNCCLGIPHLIIIINTATCSDYYKSITKCSFFAYVTLSHINHYSSSVRSFSYHQSKKKIISYFTYTSIEIMEISRHFFNIRSIYSRKGKIQ